VGGVVGGGVGWGAECKAVTQVLQPLASSNKVSFIYIYIYINYINYKYIYI
jgi:hypothetical protein